VNPTTVVNPWLSIPLAEYEAHMTLPDIAQGPALASELASLVGRHRPSSLALLGCSGGNGLERLDPAVTTRVVALDVNPAYVAIAARRHARSFDRFEPVVCDLAAAREAPFAEVDLVFAGLLLEYVPLATALRFVRSALRREGVFGCVLQVDSKSTGLVSPSPYTSLAVLSGYMSLVTPEEVEREAATSRLRITTMGRLRMPNGKELVTQSYLAE
jgi:hypothetical protein